MEYRQDYRNNKILLVDYLLLYSMMNVEVLMKFFYQIVVVVVYHLD